MDDQTVLAWGQPQASLVIRQGAQVGTTFSISGSEVILGREEGLEISIRDPEVSRRHARISWQGDSYHVEDLGSTNGTFLNGALVSSPQPLRAGDTIGIGQTVLVFQTETGGIPPQPAAGSPYAAPSPPTSAPATEQRGRSRCLVGGCGCLVLLGLLLVVAAVVLLLAFPQELEDFLNGILNTFGLETDIAMLYISQLLV